MRTVTGILPVADAVLVFADDRGIEGAHTRLVVTTLERVADGERLGLEHVIRSPGADRSDPFSMREREVLAMLALGSSNREIARELFLSVDTVKTYVRRVFQKLGVHNRTQAAILAQQYELAPPAARLERLRTGSGESGPM